MTPKQEAQYLHAKGFDYTDACNIAGWSPYEEMRKQLIHYCKVSMTVVFITALALFAIDAIPEERKQLTDVALASCLNGTGMVINGELWVCENTRMRA